MAARPPISAATGEFAHPTESSGLFHLEARGLDHRTPTGDLGIDESLCLLRVGIGNRLQAGRHQHLLELRIRHGLSGGLGNAIDHGLGCAGGREQAEEEEADHVRQSLLDCRRDVRGRLEPLRSVDREAAELAGAMQLEHLTGDVRTYYWDVSADEIGESRTRAL